MAKKTQSIFKFFWILASGTKIKLLRSQVKQYKKFNPAYQSEQNPDDGLILVG
jgi:hypothetical protein